MNEYIELQFRKPNGQRLRVKRQVSGGIEFEEPDPIERTVGIRINGRGDATKHRIRSLEKVKGWGPGGFRLTPSVEDGNIVLRGFDQDSLPEGLYAVRVQIEEAKTRQATANVEIKQDGHGLIVVDVHRDERGVSVDLSSCDDEIDRVIDASVIEERDLVADVIRRRPARQWLEATDPRAARKACLLNLLATLRVLPSKTSALITDVESVFHARNDRIYMKVKAGLHKRVQALVKDPKKRFYAEGKPTAPIHLELLGEIPVNERSLFENLLSFRGEGRPSMQIVIAEPVAGLPHTYAEFDLDLANPLQDLVGFVFHAIEVGAGKETNHLDLRTALAKEKAGEFLYYNVNS
ncbi:MAG: hypothetical protein Q8O42_17280 [Acidobacteriota bacterium]|nr:hypothetical protein [Acidobacteriota bacterium]